MPKKTEITPAALLKGDIDNAIIASTPGGIEKQEAEGQKVFVNSTTLPRRFLYCTKEQLEKIGIKFLENADDLFVNVELPKGWEKRATNHSMWSELIDEKGRKRARIFYKAAFYDRDAHISINNRFSARRQPEDFYKSRMSCQERNAGKWAGIVYDCDEIIWQTKWENPPKNDKDFAFDERIHNEAKNWLNENYPKWQEPTEYWD